MSTHSGAPGPETGLVERETDRIKSTVRPLAAELGDICSGEWGKPLGEGLYEFRIRKSLRTILVSAGLEAPAVGGADRSVLLRVFCTFHGNRIVLLHHGYDKKADPSLKRQQREIAKARKIHERWKRQRHNA